MNTSAFWAAACERAVKTFAQALIALIGAGAISVTAIPWPDDLGIAATAALLSVLTSLLSSTIGNAGPSLATETLTPPAPSIVVFTATPPVDPPVAPPAA